jgi:hypothetical protein
MSESVFKSDLGQVLHWGEEGRSGEDGVDGAVEEDGDGILLGCGHISDLGRWGRIFVGAGISSRWGFQPHAVRMRDSGRSSGEQLRAYVMMD